MYFFLLFQRVSLFFYESFSFPFLGKFLHFFLQKNLKLPQFFAFYGSFHFLFPNNSFHFWQISFLSCQKFLLSFLREKEKRMMPWGHRSGIHITLLRMCFKFTKSFFNSEKIIATFSRFLETYLRQKKVKDKDWWSDKKWVKETFFNQGYFRSHKSLLGCTLSRRKVVDKNWRRLTHKGTLNFGQSFGLHIDGHDNLMSSLALVYKVELMESQKNLSG